MAKAVLIVTHGMDGHTSLVRAALDEMGIEAISFDTGNFDASRDLIFEIVNGDPVVLLRVEGVEHRGDKFSAVFYRNIRLPLAPPQISDPEARQLAKSELWATLDGALLALEPALWMNHPHANRLARSKLLQLRLASRCGFDVPETRVTANSREVRALYRAWDGQMVAKLVGGQLVGETVDSQYIIHTTIITKNDLEDHAALSACPAIYQRRLDKLYELRVTVVGEEVFACRIPTDKLGPTQVDRRELSYKILDLEPCTLDRDDAERCRTLLRELGLEMAGIDLIVTPQNKTVFLEINAVGQWAFVQEATGLPIATAIARRLACAARANSPASHS